MTSRKLRQLQADMRRRHQKVRPWDHAKETEAFNSVLRLRTLFKRGLSDKAIAKIVGFDVSILRPTECCQRRAIPVARS